MPQSRAKVSAFIITFNEEQKLPECLESVRFCDEIVVVDSNSKDHTVEIAERFGARVIIRPWSGYIEQKAFALAQASHEWVLNIDADERITPELQRSIEQVLERDARGAEPATIAGYEVNRVVYHLGRWWRRGGWYPEWRLRLMRKSKITWGGLEPHERPIPSGEVRRLDGEMEHLTYDGLAQQFDRIGNLSTLAAQQDYARGKRTKPISLVLNPFLRFMKFYVVKRGFREGTAGFIVAVAEAWYTFMKYSKVWELEFNERRGQSTGAAPTKTSQEKPLRSAQEG
ncbi:MAG: glycosyltransferase family 2 protein [Deltaproteobacteria bacterium]|nr:glycosyltransferase family 2 protein [Deltaproteobacteria bacterium]